MSRSRKSVPSYLHHKAKNLAFVRLPDGKGGRRFVYLGRYDSPESHAEYRRLLAELQTNQDSPIPSPVVRPTAVSVNEILVGFMNFALTHYRDADGKPTTEVDEIKRSLAPLRRLFGATPANEFGPRSLTAVRQEMIRSQWCRTLINRRIDRVKRAFRWASSEELVSVTVYTALRTLPGLARGRTEVRESEPVKPVDPALVTATLPFLNRHVRAAVELQQLTGMRPGETCGFRFAEVDRSGDVWLYQPTRHKTAHRGKVRVIPVGPRARAVIAAFLVGDRPPPEGFVGIDLGDDTARLVAADAYQEAGRDWDAGLLRDLARPVAFVAGCVVDPAASLFNPTVEREDRFRTMRAGRKSKVQPSQIARHKTNPQRRPGIKYTSNAYITAISRACDKAGVACWHPNQLRHTFATEVRKAHGLEAAGAVLGHTKMSATEVYAERDVALAVRIATQMG